VAVLRLAHLAIKLPNILSQCSEGGGSGTGDGEGFSDPSHIRLERPDLLERLVELTFDLVQTSLGFSKFVLEPVDGAFRFLVARFHGHVSLPPARSSRPDGRHRGSQLAGCWPGPRPPSRRES